MPDSLSSVTRSAVQQLAGTRAPALPTQRTLWRRVRAALAFQPAYPPPLTAAPDPVTKPAISAHDSSATTELARPIASSSGESVPRALQEALAALPATTRLKARGDSLVAAATHAVQVSDAINHAADRMSFPADVANPAPPFDLMSTLDQALSRQLIHALDHALTLARALNHALALARDLSLLRRLAPAATLDFIHDLDDVLDAARVRAHDEVLGDAPDHHDDSHLDCTLGRSLADSLDRALNRVYTLDRTLAQDLARALALNSYRDLAHTLERALTIAQSLADDLINGHRHGLVYARALDLVDGLVQSCTGITAHLPQLAREFIAGREQAVARLLGLDPDRSRGLSRAILDGVLDDFTAADLSAANLKAARLSGMYWSVWGTLWPQTFDVERLKSVSREVDPGSGVYLVEHNVPSIEIVSTMA